MEQEKEQALIDAFQMMWGNYHEPVRLIHRSFRVVAANAACLGQGGKVGVKCNTGNPELHRGCRAMASLKERKTQIQTSLMEGVQWVSYWVPVEGCDDYFIHFTNGLNEYMALMARQYDADRVNRGKAAADIHHGKG